jgi:hypothetical protein
LRNTILNSWYLRSHNCEIVLLCTLFSNTLCLCSSLTIRDHVSHTYRTTGKIIVLYIPSAHSICNIRNTRLHIQRASDLIQTINAFKICLLFYLFFYQRERNQLGRPRRRRIDNIKMDLLEIGLSVVDWIGLAQDRYRYVVMNLQAP